MNRIVALASLLAIGSTAAIAGPALQICHGEYALCAASSTDATGKSIVVNGNTFREGVSVCPILHGPAIADMNLMGGSCKVPPGKVWSLFSNVKNYPQAPTWAVMPEVVRAFTTAPTPGGGMSNMWSFPCVKREHLVNGVQLADCYGPLNESPWTSTSVPFGSVVGTAAPVGASNPVGGNIP